MGNILWVLLVSTVIMCLVSGVVSASPITDEDVSVVSVIDDGDPSDEHDENGWLVAGSGVSSTIGVDYIGNSSPDIHYVRFVSLEKEMYGDVGRGYVESAPYNTTFSMSNNTAGNAPILVQINYTEGSIDYDYEKIVYQPIDHATPYRIQTIAYENEVTIADVTNISMTMEDAYGNIVTSLYEDSTGTEQECVIFETTRHAGSGFYNSTGYDADCVFVPVNADGTIAATFRVGTDGGPMYLIHIVPPVYADDTWLTINGLTNDEPCTMYISVVPNVDSPPYVPADGESKFYLTYTLYDKYWNPSGNQTVRFSDDIIGDEYTQVTNSDGQIMFSFGPFERAATFTIHAESVENSSVSADQVLQFTNTSPVNMVLTANPQSMPSADVQTSTGAYVCAKVMDEHGNGVPLENVSFSIVPPASGYCVEQNTAPSVVDTEITNVDGIASAHFTPGSFITDDMDENYNATASETCTVQATWGDITRSIDLEWKNFPYLRVETEVEPETVEVGDTIDVNIRLIGDGWALYSDPIDVMLSADRSWSMLYDYPDRMVSLMGALKAFNDEMIEGHDRIGLTSFGGKGKANIDSAPDRLKFLAGIDGDVTDFSNYVLDHYPGNGVEYSDYATLDLNLSSNRTVVGNAIDNLVPYYVTPMRPGLYLAIHEIVENGRDDAVRAVILVSDGDYNRYGDPLARGTDPGTVPTDATYFYDVTEYFHTIPEITSEEQNLSVYANNNNITIYSIAFGDGLSEKGVGTLRTLAESTGGTYFYAPDGDDLEGIYTDIAGELKTEAGVNTEMNVLFDEIERNNVTQPNLPGDPILEYEYVPDVSTLIKSWNTTGSPPGSEESPNVILPHTLNQTDEWCNSQTLSFNNTEIGTICLGQTWQGTFRLNVSKAGNINIFGVGSVISFNNGTDTLTLPKTYVTAVPDLNATGINFRGLKVYDLTCVEAENGCVIKDDLTVRWNLNYTGIYNATQFLYYKNVDDNVWICFDCEEDGPTNGTMNHIQKLYVGDFPPGEYHLRVWATAEDAPDSFDETVHPITIGRQMDHYILLE